MIYKANSTEMLKVVNAALSSIGLPEVDLEYDNYGQLVIYTGLIEDSLGKLLDMYDEQGNPNYTEED